MIWAASKGSVLPAGRSIGKTRVLLAGRRKREEKIYNPTSHWFNISLPAGRKLGRSIIKFPPHILLKVFCLKGHKTFIIPFRSFFPQGLYDCCSDYPVTFHYISPERMFAIEYFLYSVKLD